MNEEKIYNGKVRISHILFGLTMSGELLRSR